MTNFFYYIIRKSFKVLKKEPSILLPAFIIYLILNFIGYSGLDLNTALIENLNFTILVGWVIPSLIIEPMVIFWAWVVIRKIDIDFKTSLNQYFYGLGGVFVISLIYKPLEIYMTVKIYQSAAANIENWITEVNGFILVFWMVSLIFRLVIFYFNFDYLTSLNRKPNILNSLKTSIKLFFKFKWLTIGSIVFWQIFFYVLSFFILNLVSLLPKILEGAFLSLLIGTQSVLSMIFFLNIYLRIKPVVNLNDN